MRDDDLWLLIQEGDHLSNKLKHCSHWSHATVFIEL
jgi:hypothetical protein